MIDVNALVEQVEKEASAMGVAFADGFQIADIPCILEAIAKVIRTTDAIWSEYSDSEKRDVMRDMILSLDEKYALSEKAADILVSWDIPNMPDALVDIVFNRTVVKDMLRGVYILLIESIFRQFERRAQTMGPRAWELLSERQ